MSRIIKQGNLPTKSIECSVCGCVFEYTEMDTIKVRGFHGHFCDIQTSEIYDKFVPCPCCNKRHMIKPQMPTNESAVNSDFMEDVKALAKQYGYELIGIEVK